MGSSGIDRRTGKVLKDWAHIQQSIEDIVTTAINTRVMRRPYGSNSPKLVDANMNDQALLALYVTVATALALWEPRFELTDVGFDVLSPTGQVQLRLAGDELPDGHRGDKSTRIARSWGMTL